MSYTLTEHQSKKLFNPQVLSESVGLVGKIKPETIVKLNESAKGKTNRKLVVQMEAIHVGRTANYTFYTEQGLKDGIKTWTHPYSKPVLTHHDAHNGEPVGRILKAEYSDTTPSGRKGLLFTCEITDQGAIEKVLDGRYQTVSIGATTDKVTCNICGTDRTKEWCDHWKGEEYDGQTCSFIIGTTFGREVSYVNVPADENAGNISVTQVDDGDGNTSESATLTIFQIAEGLMQNVDLPDVNLYESATDDVKQLVDGLVKTEEGSAPIVKYTINESGQIVDETGKILNIEEMNGFQTKFTEAQAQVTTLQTQLTEAQSALATMTVEKTKLDSQFTESKNEVERLTTENAGLIEKAHKALAEKVVDMKLALRKSDVVGVAYEEAVAEHIKRTEESLNDAAKDLQVEMQNTTVARGSITNPGNGGPDNNPNEDNDKPVTVSEAVNMFKGMFGSKKR
jgi:hypothetical protein